MNMDRYQPPSGLRDDGYHDGTDAEYRNCDGCYDHARCMEDEDRNWLCLGCWTLDHPHCAWGEYTESDLEEDAPTAS